MKICVVCAPGGHLTEATRLTDAFVSHSVFLLTYEEEFLSWPRNIGKVYFAKNFLVGRVHANRFTHTFFLAIQMLTLAVMELRILLMEKPDVVLSLGSEIAIPIFYFAKILGKKVIFVESLCRVHKMSGTAKAVYPISDLMLVQWEFLAKKHEKTQYRGNLLFSPTKSKPDDKVPKEDLVLVTVGTASFPRLIRKMDEIAEEIDKEIIIQTGRTEYKPKNTSYFDFRNYQEICTLTKRATVVVSHAGVGTILTALEQGGRLIIVPRLKEYREVYDNHQSELAEMLKESGRAKIAYDVDQIPGILAEDSEPADFGKIDINEERKCLTDFLKDYLSSIEKDHCR